MTTASRSLATALWRARFASGLLLLSYTTHRDATGVRDIGGKFHPFELDENTLYELDHRGEAVIPEQYRISERIAK